MKNVDEPAVRLVDANDETLAEVLPDELSVTLGSIAAVCREGLMAVAVEAGLATAAAIMNEEVGYRGPALPTPVTIWFRAVSGGEPFGARLW